MSTETREQPDPDVSPCIMSAEKIQIFDPHVPVTLSRNLSVLFSAFGVSPSPPPSADSHMFMPPMHIDKDDTIWILG